MDIEITELSPKVFRVRILMGTSVWFEGYADNQEEAERIAHRHVTEVTTTRWWAA